MNHIILTFLIIVSGIITYLTHHFLFFMADREHEKLFFYLPSFYKETRLKPLVLFIVYFLIIGCSIKFFSFLPILPTEPPSNTAPPKTELNTLTHLNTQLPTLQPDNTPHSQPAELSAISNPQQYPAAPQKTNQIIIIKRDNTRSPNTVFANKIHGAAIDASDSF